MSEKNKKEPEVIVKKLNSNKAIVKNPVMVTKGGIEPEGTLEITENGQYNVTEYAEANINVADIPAKLQTKTLTPTKSVQNVTPDSGYEGFSSVTVNAIPSSYIQPSGTLEITEPGETDVREYEKVNVTISGTGGSGNKYVTFMYDSEYGMNAGDASFSQFYDVYYRFDNLITDLNNEDTYQSFQAYVNYEDGSNMSYEDSIGAFSNFVHIKCLSGLQRVEFVDNVSGIEIIKLDKPKEYLIVFGENASTDNPYVYLIFS